MKRYEGRRISGIADVCVNGVPLNPRLDLWKHSVTGFEWGYGGSGPAQLALALLADCLGDDRKAVKWHQEFKFAVIAGFAGNTWTLTEEEILKKVAEFEAGRMSSAAQWN